MPRTPLGALGALAVIAGAGILTTCTTDSSGPGRRAAFAVEPVFAPTLHLSAFNLTVDNVRLIVVRPPADTVYDQTAAFPANQSTLQLAADIPLNTSPESFDVTIQMLSGTTLLFSGTQTESISEGTNSTPAQIPVAYSGPGQNIATLTIDPPDSLLTWDGTLAFRTTALDAQQNPVTSYYLSWSTSDATVPVDATGQITATHFRKTVTVTATTPTNISASTTLTLLPAAAAITVTSGCGQSAAPGSQLPQPIVAKVIAVDNGGVQGVTVTFTPPSGGTAVPAQAVTDANGQAQTTMTLGPTPGPQQFSISAPGLPSFPCTQTAAGLATHLAFTTEPSNVQVGSSITPAVVITALDANNQPVPSFTGNVTMTIGTNPLNATLGGTTTIAAVAGAATFNDLTLDKVGTGFTLSASSPGLSNATSAVFNVVTAGGAHLVFSAQPSNVTAGAAITPAIIVAVEDANNNPVLSFNGNVTLAFGTCPAGATLSGTATVAVSAAIATFADISIDKAGGCTLVASAATLQSVASVSFTIAAAAATKLGFTTQPSNVVAGVIISPVVAVAVQDQFGNTVPSASDNITVAIGTNPGGATLGGTATKAASSGIALFSTITLDKIGTGYTLSATAPSRTGATSSTFNVTAAAAASVVKISGDNQTGAGGAALAQPLVVEVRDAFANVVSGATVTWASPSGGSFTPASGPTGTNGQAQTSWTLGPSAPSQAATATVGALTPASFSATATIGTPAISLSFAGVPGVGIGLSAKVYVDINQPAPAGGQVITLVSGNTTIFTVSAPSVTISQGKTRDSVDVTGGSPGTANLTASASGFADGVLSVNVQSRAIALPPTINVPFGDSTQIPVQIAAPAPFGGVDIDVASDNTANVAVSTSPVHINAGGLTVNATLIGVKPGSAVITASNPAYNFATSTATTTASLDIVQPSATLNASFGTSITINFESPPGTSKAAPSPGITVDLAAADPTCLGVPAQTTITTGFVSTTAPLTYGGSATLPCTTKLLAQATNLQPDSINVTVNPVPVITMFTPAQGTGRLGVGLQDQGSGSLQVANPGPGSLTVHLVSSDQTVLLLAPDATTAGTPTLDVQVPINQSGFSYFIQGVGLGTATISASAPLYANGASPTVTVETPGLDILSVPTTTTSLSANVPFQVRLGAPNAATTALVAEQSLRAGQPTLTATIKNRNTVAAQLVTTALTGQQVTVSIAAGQARSPSTKASGGVEYDPLGAGADTVTATIPGFVVFPGAPDSVPVTVTAPLITMFTPAQGTGRLGVGLQDQGSGSLQVANQGPGSLTVHLVSSDPAVLLLAPDAATPGAPTLDVLVPILQSGFSYFIQGVAAGTATITASAPAYSNGTSPTVNVVTPGLDILGLPSSTTSLAANDPFQVRLGAPNAANTALAAEQSVSAGGTTLVATIKNRNTGAAQLVTTATTGQTVTVQIAAGQARSPSTKALGGVEYDPLGAGPDTVTATIPGFVVFPGTADSIPITITAPLITMFTPAQGTGRLGVGLQDQGSGSLQTANPGPSALTVHLVSSDPTVMLLAPDAATAGTPTLDVQVPVNGSGFSYFIQGVATGTATVTASGPPYTPGTSPTVTVATPGFDILGLVASTTSLSANDPFLIRIGVPNAAGTALSAEQVIRAGGTAVTATIKNRAPAAAQLVTSATNGNQVTVQILAGQARSPSTLVTGGVEYDPLGAGFDTVTASIPGFAILKGASDSVAVTVTAPLITMFTPAQGTGRLGAGLQDQGSGSLQTANPGPDSLMVHLVSSQPSVLLLAPNATTQGTPTLDVFVQKNQSGFSYFVQGVEGSSGTVTITATASGYTPGTATLTVAQPGFDILGVPSTITTLAANGAFFVRLGVPNSGHTALAAEQAIRAGGTAVTATVRNANTTAAQLVTSLGVGQQATVQIAVGQARSPSTIGNGGVEYDPLAVGIDTVSASIPGFTIFQGAPDSVAVSVTTPLINMFTPAQGTGRLGVGLQDNGSGSLQTANPGPTALTVHLASSDPTVLLIAPDAATPGTPTLDIQVPANQSGISYFVQGIGLGTATITATAPAYAPGTSPTVTVVQPGFDILGLSTSISSQAANAPFLVRLGAPNVTNTSLVAEQSLITGSSPLTVTITSTSSTAAQLVTTQTTGLSVDVQIAGGQARSPNTVAAGGVAFDPLAQGSTTVSAAISGFLAMTTGSILVNVGP